MCVCVCVYLCQLVGVKSSGPVGVAEPVLPAARASDGRVLGPSQRVVPAHRHGDGGGGAPAALGAVEGRGQALAPPQQQLPGAEVARHRRRAPLHHAAVAVAVVGAAEVPAEQTVGSLPPVTGGTRRSEKCICNYFHFDQSNILYFQEKRHILNNFSFLTLFTVL